MQRWKKQLWNGTLLTVAVMLIVAAVAMGAVRLLDLVAPQYREELADRLSEEIDLPVTIGGIGMRWQAFRPTFELDNVIILDDSRRPVFQVGHIGLPFKWGELFRGELLPHMIELHGLAVSLEWRADGSIGISGVQAGTDGGEMDLAEVLVYLDKIDRIRLIDGVVSWKDLGEPIGLTRIERVNAEIVHRSDGLHMEVVGRLPRHLGEQFGLTADLTGDLGKPDDLQISTRFAAAELYPDGWLAPMLRETVALRGGPLKVEFQSAWQGLIFRHANIQVSAQPQKDVGSDQSPVLPGLETDLLISPLGDGWEMKIQRLQYVYEEGEGPISNGRLRYQPTPDGFGTRLDAELNVIEAADVIAWMSVLELSRGHVLPIASKVHGRLLNTRFNYYQAPGAEAQYDLSSEIQGLSMPAEGYLPGLKGFNGNLYATQEAGRFEINTTQGAIDLPAVFAREMPLNRFQSIMHWERAGSQWRLFSENLALDFLTTRAEGDLSLVLDGRPSPYIDLRLAFSASDIVPLKPFIPLPPALPESVGNWLASSLEAGKVSGGDFVLRGRLADFPYEDPGKEGLFRIQFKAEDTSLTYAEGWPQVDGIHGIAVFQGRSMSIEADRGEILGVPIVRAHAAIPDFLDPVLKITGRVQSDAAKQMSFLPNSPLESTYRGLIDAIEISGPAQLDLNLGIPLADASAARIAGDIFLQGVELKYSGLDIPVKDIKGLVKFSGKGLAAEALLGEFAGLRTTARLSPIETESGQMTQLEAVAELNLPENAQALGRHLSDLNLDAMKGATQIRFSSRFDTSASASGFTISSDFKGMQFDMGSPFRKKADEVRPMKLVILPKETTVDVRWEFPPYLHGLLRYHRMPDGYGLTGGVLQLGSAEGLELPLQKGFYLKGKTDALDLTGLPLTLMGGGGSSPMPIHVDVSIGKFQYANQLFENLVLRSGGEERLPVTRERGFLSVKSDQASGMLRWQPNPAGRTKVTGEFDALSLQAPKAEKTESDVSDKPVSKPLDPAEFPLLSLHVKDFRMGGERLGSLKLDTQGINTGLRLAALELGGRKIEVRGGGEWVRQEGQSSARLVMNINGEDIIGLLNATGYAPNITAKQADIFMELDWAPDASGLELKNLNGKMSFDLVDGSLLEVKPGAGRVLSLLSFYSLPRRLTLDFSDVLGKGTAFDKLTGDFAIVDGNATTDDLEVTLPSGKIEVRGRVGLAVQDYDQTVTIYPELSSGVALAGAVLGGPVLGIGLWIAQELLEKPFDQVAQLSYRLTGSWDDPVVKPLDAKPVSERDRGKKEGKANNKRVQTRGARKSPAQQPAEIVETEESQDAVTE